MVERNLLISLAFIFVDRDSDLLQDYPNLILPILRLIFYSCCRS